MSGHVTQQSNDQQQVEPTLAQPSDQSATIGFPIALLADAGYYSAGNVKAVAANDTTCL